MQIWKPDTCPCIIEQDYSNLDGSLKGQKFLSQCPDHASPDDVLAENKNKNIVIAKVKSSLPTLKDEEITFSFDNKRNLQINLQNINQSDKLKAQSDLVNNKVQIL